jgi:hypothetical protein
MPKDKLMQAAGRMRQLGRGQTLLVMGLPDITAKISAAAAVVVAAAAAAPSAAVTLASQPGPGLLGLLDSFSSGQQPKKPLLAHAHKSSSSSSSSNSNSSSSSGDGGKGEEHQPDMRCVLSWVLCNTVQDTLSGIPQAAGQGMHFAATYGGPPEACVLPERLSVNELYGSSKIVEPVGQLLQDMAQFYVLHAQAHAHDLSGAPGASAGLTVFGAANSNGTGSIGGGVGGSSSASTSVGRFSSPASSTSEDHQAMAASDVLHVAASFSDLGAGHSVLAGQGADEECERELQQEEEQEQEAEVQVPAATAAAETDWDWASAFTASSPAGLVGCNAMRLTDVLQLVASAGGVRDISWCDKVWASHNFVNSVTTSAASPGLTDYLRPVGALLVFPGSSQVLLLSEREADILQGELWAASAAGAAPPSWQFRAPATPNVLLSLPYLRLACSQDDSGAESGAARSHSTAQHKQQQLMYLASVLTTGRSTLSPAELAAQVNGALGVSSLVAEQLFAGVVMYGSGKQRALLQKWMSGRRGAAQEIVVWRGQLHMLPRSDLDRACA